MKTQRHGGLTLREIRELHHRGWPAPVDRPKRDASSSWLAPLRRANGQLDNAKPKPWEGSSKVKPWEHKITAAIVHLDTPDLLAVVVELLRHQTERPHIIVVDAGSHAQHRAALEAMEAEDLEIALLRPRGWRATSQAVAAGMDVASALCQTEFLYATHVDVFLKKRDYLEFLLGQCDARTPVVGWQMSPRPRWPEPLWAQIPSHTASMYHMPTLRRLGLSWSMLGAFEELGLEPAQPYGTGWPDTEVNLGLGMMREGIKIRWPNDPPPAGLGMSWLCLGPEANEPYTTDWFDHVRSTTSHRLFGSDGPLMREQRLAAAVDEARARIIRWNKPRVDKGAPCVPCQETAAIASRTATQAADNTQ